MSTPATWHIYQTRTETVPIGWDFSADVDGAVFELEHSLFGTFTLTGVGRRVEFPITEERAAVDVGTHWYVLTANPTVLGYEQIAARGRWFIGAREPE